MLRGELSMSKDVELPMLSGSMSPTIVCGNTIRIRPVSWNRILRGDIIVFKDNGRLIAHRLLARISFGRFHLAYQKGDTNDLGKWISGRCILGIVTAAWDTSGNRVYLRNEAKNLMQRTAYTHSLRVIINPFFRISRLFKRLSSTPLKNRNTACCIQVGQTSIRLDFPTPGMASRMRRYFQTPAEPDSIPDIGVRLRIVRADKKTVPHSMFVDKSVHQELFSIAGMLEGSFSRDRSEATVRVNEHLLSGRLVRVFEQFLYQVFYSDPRNRRNNSFLIHASGVISMEKGYIFTGPSGAGKSTIAGLSSKRRIMNDEICLVSFEGERAWVSSTPFNGFFRRKIPCRAPLEAVFIIAQGKQHAVRNMDRTTVSSALIQQIVPPIGIDEVVTKKTISDILDLSEALQRRVPVYGLEFTRDAGFWKEIDGIRRREKHGDVQ